MVYGVIIAIMPILSDSGYYNLAALYRLLFSWGATYLCFDIEQSNKNSVTVWALKWILIYVTGFQLVRLVFNYFFDNSITWIENSILLSGLVLTIFLAINHWRNDHT